MQRPQAQTDLGRGATDGHRSKVSKFEHAPSYDRRLRIRISSRRILERAARGQLVTVCAKPDEVRWISRRQIRRLFLPTSLLGFTQEAFCTLSREDSRLKDDAHQTCRGMTRLYTRILARRAAARKSIVIAKLQAVEDASEMAFPAHIQQRQDDISTPERSRARIVSVVGQNVIGEAPVVCASNQESNACTNSQAMHIG